MASLFVLFWVNIVFLVAMFAFCYCGIKVLGRKGQQEEAQQQQPGEEGDDGRSHAEESAPVPSHADRISRLYAPAESSDAGVGAAAARSSSKADHDAVEAWTARLVEALLGCTTELAESDVLGCEDDSYHPFTTADRDDENDEEVAILVDRPVSTEEEGRSLDVEAGGRGAASVAGFDDAVGEDDDDKARRAGTRAGLSSESADVSESFGDGTTWSRARIRVPASGQHRQQQQQQKHNDGHLRLVPNQCAICLSSMACGESVTWSSNPNCQHVFHHCCILVWLEASSKKERERRRRQQQHPPGRRTPSATNDLLLLQVDDKVEDAVPLPCPCCRQEFVLSENRRPEEGEDDGDQGDRGRGSNGGSVAAPTPTSAI